MLQWGNETLIHVVLDGRTLLEELRLLDTVSSPLPKNNKVSQRFKTYCPLLYTKCKLNLNMYVIVMRILRPFFPFRLFYGYDNDID